MKRKPKSKVTVYQPEEFVSRITFRDSTGGEFQFNIEQFSRLRKEDILPILEDLEEFELEVKPECR